MHEIQNWLAGKRSYTEGVRLYVKHGKDPALKNLFLWEGWSAFKEAKLVKALEELTIGPNGTQKIDHKLEIFVPGKEFEKLIGNIESDVNDHEWRLDSLEDDIRDKISPIEQLQKDVAHLKKNTVPKTKGWPQVMDATLQQLHDQWRPLFSEKKNLQARIYDVALAGQQDEDKKRQAGAMAARILDLRDECRKIYEKRDFYLNQGKLPEEKKPFDLDIPTDPKRWPKTEDNYARYIRQYRAKLAKDPENKNFQYQLDKYTWGLAEVRRLMGS